MICYAELSTSNGGSAQALSYSSGIVTPTNSRVKIETGTGYWALKIDDEYSLVYDVDGLVIGDVEQPSVLDYPRLQFYGYLGGVKQKMATITASGRLQANNVQEVGPGNLPTNGMTFFNNVAITPLGIFAEKVSEVWFITDNNGNYVCSDGQLIAIQGGQSVD